MEVAITHTMPSTVHRLCKWHVMKSIKENLGALYKKGTPFRIDFNRLTNEMMTVDEFDRGWAYLMDTYGLAGNRYMAHIYDCRDKWAKPYLSSNFCAKMCSTQRNECMNNVLKSYVSLSAPLNRFVL